MKIYVAIPVYDGKLQVETVNCLLQEQLLASGFGDVLHVAFLPSCSVPAHGRNRLVRDFLDSDSERLFFLDADITFEPGDLLKVAHKPVEVVGGAYRYKRSDESYPIGWGQGSMSQDALGLIEVETIPTGFSCFSRSVFEKFQNKFPKRFYTSEREELFCFFQMVFDEGKMHSDDSYFCKEWRSIGGKVHLYPELSLTHWDQNIAYKGHVGNWLRFRQENL
jgi:hypothetical protein